MVSEDAVGNRAPTVSVVSGIMTRDNTAPSFVSILLGNATVDENAGTFAMNITATLDKPGTIYYAVYR